MRILLTLLCAASLTFAGCSDDSGGSTTDAGNTADVIADAGDTTTVDDTATVDDTWTDATMMDGAWTDTTTMDGTWTDDSVMPAGSCMNADDGQILATEDVAGATSTIATSCFLGGATEDDAYVACALEALITETELSEGCAGCFVDSALCAKNNCLTECLSDPVACEECRATNGCTASFYECSGLPVPE